MYKINVVSYSFVYFSQNVVIKYCFEDCVIFCINKDRLFCVVVIDSLEVQ